jgi:hypothetical protein
VQGSPHLSPFSGERQLWKTGHVVMAVDVERCTAERGLDLVFENRRVLHLNPITCLVNLSFLEERLQGVNSMWMSIKWRLV